MINRSLDRCRRGRSSIVGLLFSQPSLRYFSTSGLVGASTTRPAIERLLVANRGEIACRVLTTAKRLGIPTVAVFSEADRASRHVAMADDAYCIGPPPARDSYLRQDRILEVAARTGASAIHPGYGFLSENSTFAAACAHQGIAFVGPPAPAIEAMGDKSAAKAAMAQAGVPVVPGYHGEDQEESRLAQEAGRVGYPLLVKAVMGGGGKGMKLAMEESQFLDALHSAKRESLASFGDDRVLVERFIQRPRHVEVQVFADSHGEAVYLFERDCSVQRRHQKVIEEAPAPGISEEFRLAIGQSAVAAAKAVGYVNAGTVEFILDCDTGEYFFMEMNTRLQVEHPVSEAITQQDLVEWQLRVAAGEKLPLTQQQLAIHGHAFEARLYAENPENNFLPAGGRVLRWRVPPTASFFQPPAAGGQAAAKAPPSAKGILGDPAEDSYVRVDSGVREGDLVGVNYDPMISKVVTHGPDRASALRAMHDALSQLQVAGLPTNLEFMRRITENQEFQAGPVDTGFIKKHELELLASHPVTPEPLALGALTFAHLAAQQVQQGVGFSPAPPPWNSEIPFRVNTTFTCPVSFTHPKSGTDHEVTLSYCRDGTVEVSGDSMGGGAVVGGWKVTADKAAAEVDGRKLSGSWCAHIHGEEEVLDLWVSGRQYQFRRPLVRRWQRVGEAAEQLGTVLTPMPGKIVKVFVGMGQEVAEGDSLVVVEAMKMEHTVKAPCAGVVSELHSFPGSQVDEGAVLAVVAPKVSEVASQAAAQM